MRKRNYADINNSGLFLVYAKEGFGLFASDRDDSSDDEALLSHLTLVCCFQVPIETMLSVKYAY
jgi:hypothetical protein